MPRPLTLLAVGDVAVERPDPDTMFAHVANALREGDVVFAQLETPISVRGAPSPHPTLPVRSSPDSLPAMRRAGINVVSFAGNHCMDFGYEAFFDTLQHAREAEIAICGAGANIAEARQPALLAVDGVRLAFLAYSSILPAGYWAEQERAGCAPMRAHTLYEQTELDQPGTPPRIKTFAHEADLKALLADVRAAKAKADIVVLSMHWGIHFVEGEIADYQKQIARAAIDAGVDIILGHHPHILKGIEVYKGRAIFYSLGNFAIEQPATWNSRLRHTQAYKTIHALNPSWDMDQVYTMPYETRRTMIVRCEIRDGAIGQVSYLPAFIEDGSAPRVLDVLDPRFAEVEAYVSRLTEGQGLQARQVRKGQEVVVLPVDAEMFA